jgi:ABC-type proline/glycine betaine transport system substrate-binding protein
VSFKKLLLAVTALAGATAFAQAPLGTVVNVNGVVTATQGATGTTVTTGSPIQNGMRFVTTSNGSVTLRLNSGCQVNVPPGHGVTVLQSMTCQQLTAAVQPVVPVAASQAFPPAPGLVNGVVGVTGAVVGLLVLSEIVDDDDDKPLSAR